MINKYGNFLTEITAIELPASVLAYLGSISNGHLNLHTRFDVDRGDLLDDLRGRMKINDPLVDSHLELVPGLGTLTARSLPGGDPQHLGWHPNWALDLKLLVLGSPDQVSANLLQGLDIPTGQSDPDSVDWSFLLHSLSILVSRRHCSVELVSTSWFTPALNLIYFSCRSESSNNCLV